MNNPIKFTKIAVDLQAGASTSSDAIIENTQKLTAEKNSTIRYTKSQFFSSICCFKESKSLNSDNSKITEDAALLIVKAQQASSNSPLPAKNKNLLSSSSRSLANLSSPQTASENLSQNCEKLLSSDKTSESLLLKKVLFSRGKKTISCNPQLYASSEWLNEKKQEEKIASQETVQTNVLLKPQISCDNVKKTQQTQSPETEEEMSLGSVINHRKKDFRIQKTILLSVAAKDSLNHDKINAYSTPYKSNVTLKSKDDNELKKQAEDINLRNKRMQDTSSTDSKEEFQQIDEMLKHNDCGRQRRMPSVPILVEKKTKNGMLVKAASLDFTLKR